MKRLKIQYTDLKSGEVGETHDMYWFEERGVMEIVDNIGKGHYEDYFIQLVWEEIDKIDQNN